MTVNMLSPKQNQVSNGKTRKPVPEPMNLAAQTDSVAPAIILQAYQKNILVGTPNTKDASNGLSSQNFHMYCEFN